MKIRLCVMPENSNMALQQIKQMLHGLREDLALDINWVHVESEEVESKHFSLLRAVDN